VSVKEKKEEKNEDKEAKNDEKNKTSRNDYGVEKTRNNASTTVRKYAVTE